MIILVGAIAVVALVADRPQAQPDRPELPINADLIEQARPDPGCASYPRPKPSGSGDVRLGVLRLRGHCLIAETVLVDQPQVEARLAELRAERDVVAADRDVAPAPPPTEDIHPAVEGTEERQWGLEALGGAGAVHALWPEQAPKIKIGVVDSGLDRDQAEFGDRVVAVKDTELGTDEYRSHGTQVAGVLAAADDGTGVTGMAPQAELLDAQYWRNGEGRGQPGTYDEIIWAVDQGARVINVSATDSDSALLRAAYAYAELSRVVLVPAVGNCGGVDRRFTLPWEHEWDRTNCSRVNAVAGQADQPTGLGVGAVREDGTRAWFSSANRTVMIMAPGEDILTTCKTSEAGPRTLCRTEGTSFATPHVAGAAAILLARHPDARPADIRRALIASADPIGVDRGRRSDEYGYGMLNVIAAAKHLDDHPPEPLPEEPMITAAGRIDGKLVLITNFGEPVEVQRIGSAPGFAFSPDGAWFAAADGKVLTIVDAVTGRQRSVECACNGAAFDSADRVLTVQTRGGVKIARYDPWTAEWTGQTTATSFPSGGLDAIELVAVAGDVALVTLSQGQYANRLVAVWPDGRSVELFDGGLPFEEVVASAGGRYVLSTARQSCPYLIDLDRTRSAGKASTTVLWPADDYFCATAMLAHFDGDTDLRLGWLGSPQGVGYACMKAGQEQYTITGRLHLEDLPSGRSPAELPWQDLDCTTSGVWPLGADGELRARAEPPRFDPYQFTVTRTKPGGKDGQKLAEHVQDLVVRPVR